MLSTPRESPSSLEICSFPAVSEASANNPLGQSIDSTMSSQRAECRTSMRNCIDTNTSTCQSTLSLLLLPLLPLPLLDPLLRILNFAV